ncbi:MAG: hypothetical protein ACKPKO_14865, partial [Candidatus Fonsibacter sp.]
EQQQQPMPRCPPHPPLHVAFRESLLSQRLQRLPNMIKRQRHMLNEEQEDKCRLWQVVQDIMDEMPVEMPPPP